MGCGASTPGDLRSGPPSNGQSAPVAERSALAGGEVSAKPQLPASSSGLPAVDSEGTAHGGTAVLRLISSSSSDKPPALAGQPHPSSSSSPVLDISTAADSDDAVAAFTPPSPAKAPSPPKAEASGEEGMAPVKLASTTSMNAGPGPVATLMLQHNNRYAAGDGMADSVAVSSGDQASPSASEEDDEEAAFTLDRWRRFYKWNKRKHSDLLGFLWKKFDSRTYSLFCVSYRFHDLLFAAYQGTNLLHGLSCRLESEALFGVGQVLYEIDSPTKFKVVAVFLVPGGDVPPTVSGAVDYEQWQWLKADSKDPLIRQFLSQLITGKSPSEDLGVLSSLEFNSMT